MRALLALYLIGIYKEWMIRAFTIVTLLFLTATTLYLAFTPTNTTKTASNTSIGGDFSLTSHNGKIITNQSLLGQKRLVYFGFTYCPDICPTGLQVMQAAIEKLGDKAPATFFITVDPERDTPEQLASYMQNFPPIIGLTGTPEEVKQAAKTFRIYYKKVENEESSEDYTMDHTSLIYLLDEQGYYLAHFPHNLSPDSLLSNLRKFL